MTERLTLNSLQSTGSAGRGVPAGKLPETICSINDETTRCPSRAGRASRVDCIVAGDAASSASGRPALAARAGGAAIELNPAEWGDRAI